GVLRGRRFGNALLIAAHHPLDTAALARRTAADAFPARVEHGVALRRFVAGARPVRDEDAVPSPEPPAGAFGIGRPPHPPRLTPAEPPAAPAERPWTVPRRPHERRRACRGDGPAWRSRPLDHLGPV